MHEVLDLIYDKILEEEDKILLMQMRKARIEGQSDSEGSLIPSDLVSDEEDCCDDEEEDEDISLIENLSEQDLQHYQKE